MPTYEPLTTENYQNRLDACRTDCMRRRAERDRLAVLARQCKPAQPGFIRRLLMRVRSSINHLLTNAETWLMRDWVHAYTVIDDDLIEGDFANRNVDANNRIQT